MKLTRSSCGISVALVLLLSGFASAQERAGQTMVENEATVDDLIGELETDLEGVIGNQLGTIQLNLRDLNDNVNCMTQCGAKGLFCTNPSLTYPASCRAASPITPTPTTTLDPNVECLNSGPLSTEDTYDAWVSPTVPFDTCDGALTPYLCAATDNATCDDRCQTANVDVYRTITCATGPPPLSNDCLASTGDVCASTGIFIAAASDTTTITLSDGMGGTRPYTCNAGTWNPGSDSGCMQGYVWGFPGFNSTILGLPFPPLSVITSNPCTTSAQGIVGASCGNPGVWCFFGGSNTGSNQIMGGGAGVGFQCMPKSEHCSNFARIGSGASLAPWYQQNTVMCGIFP